MNAVKQRVQASVVNRQLVQLLSHQLVVPVCAIHAVKTASPAVYRPLFRYRQPSAHTPTVPILVASFAGALANNRDATD